jgi:hypothetical protein
MLGEGACLVGWGLKFTVVEVDREAKLVADLGVASGGWTVDYSC